MFSIKVFISFKSFLSKSGMKVLMTFSIDYLSEISFVSFSWVTELQKSLSSSKFNPLLNVSLTDSSNFSIFNKSCVFVIASLKRFLNFREVSLILWNYVVKCNPSRFFFISAISSSAFLTSSSKVFNF
jgi:hypothetical protein